MADGSRAKERVVFLDRDGTINVDSGYVYDPENLVLIPGAGAALARLRGAGFRLVVVSNQSAIGRGMCAEAAVESTNARLRELLLEESADAVLDDIFYSPHHPDDPLSTRKPGLGMLPQITARYDFDPARSWMIGDKRTDIEFGLNLGLPAGHCVLLRPEVNFSPQSGLQKKPGSADGPIELPSIAEAAQYIVSQFS